MIEMMEMYTHELEKRLNEKDGNSQLVPDNITLNLEPAKKNSSSSSAELAAASFTDRRIAVMMMYVVDNSASTTSETSGCCLADLVREAAAMSVVNGKLIVVEETSNSLMIAVGSNTAAASTGTHVSQLLELFGEVFTKVRKIKTASSTTHSLIRRFNRDPHTLSSRATLTLTFRTNPEPQPHWGVQQV